MTFPTDSRDDTGSSTLSDARLAGGMSRRKVLKLSAAGGAITIMSVASRSVFASTNGACIKGCTTTPSAFGSINLSRPDRVVCVSGLSPGYWKQKQHFSSWPAGYYPEAVLQNGQVTIPATKFSSVFSPTSGVLATATLLEVISAEAHVGDAVSRSLVCAFLNAATGRTAGILTVSQVKNMWTEYANNGYFEPTAGIKWYANSTMPVNMSNPCGAGIVGYLETTWT
ncbi:MAG: hypothetical protein QMD17_02130 [Rhodocyclaceae bacterium]|jgi:hypothetical protein|nr:hypothetical protein [Rhodocyclaceae bacterium]